MIQVEEFQGDSHYMTVRSIDFDTCRISLHTASTCELIPEECDTGSGSACLVIDASLDFSDMGDDRSIELHQESHKLISQLEGNFEVIYPVLPAEMSFETRPERVIFYIRGALVDDGLMGTGLNHFLGVLSESSSRQLQCVLISCPEPWSVPEEQINKLRFRTLYATLFGDGDMTLGQYADTAEVLETLNPDLSVSWLNMKFHARSQGMLLLLGEPEC
ncbi:MAG: hypothetical protein VW877_16190 [Pseudomonadaceae bacterium]